MDIKLALSEGKFKEATNQWSELESIVEEESGGVDFYNILRYDSQSGLEKRPRSSKNKLGTYNKKLNKLNE